MPTPPAKSTAQPRPYVNSLFFFLSWDQNITIPSKIRATPSSRSLPIHRIAKARRMCPCATMRTSPAPHSSFGLPMIGLWYVSLISDIRASRRDTTSLGDLNNSS